MFGGHGTAARAVEVLAGADLPARLVEDVDTAPEPGVALVTCGQLATGFLSRSRCASPSSRRPT